MKFHLFYMFFLFYNSLKINQLQALITLFIMSPWALTLYNIKKNPRKAKKSGTFVPLSLCPVQCRLANPYNHSAVISSFVHSASETERAFVINVHHECSVKSVNAVVVYTTRTLADNVRLLPIVAIELFTPKDSLVLQVSNGNIHFLHNVLHLFLMQR